MPLVVWNLVEALDFGLGGAVDQEAQCVVDDDGVVDLAGVLIGLADEHHSRAVLGLEKTFHPGHRSRLVAGHILAVQVAGGEDDEDRGNQSGDDANLEKNAAILVQPPFQKIKCAYGGHYE